MAFSLSLAVDLFKHRLLAAKRIFKNLPADYYVEQNKKHNFVGAQKISALPSVCHICGFSMAELLLDNNWSIKTCSATGFKNILNNPQLAVWQKSLHEI